MEHMVIEAKIESLEILNARMESEINKLQWTELEKFHFMLALEESFVNIATYAYLPEEKYKKVIVEYETDQKKNKIIVSLTDYGRQFNPLKVKKPDFQIYQEQEKEGGLGIFLWTRLADKVSYQYTEGCNKITFEVGKRLE